MDPLLARGIELFNRREYFECHEVWEAAWTPERGPRRLFLQSLIHVAVALHHHGRGNPEGARRQLRKALRKMADFLPVYEGIDTGRLFEEARVALERVEAGAPVEDYPLVRRATSGTGGEQPLGGGGG